MTREREILTGLFRAVAAELITAAERLEQLDGQEEVFLALTGGARRNRVRDQVCEAVAIEMELTTEDLGAGSRKQPYAHARQYCYLILYRLPLGYSSQDLGRLFGRRSHSTVLHGIKAAEARLVGDPPGLAWLFEIHAEACRELDVLPSNNPISDIAKPPQLKRSRGTLLRGILG